MLDSVRTYIFKKGAILTVFCHQCVLMCGLSPCQGPPVSLAPVAPGPGDIYGHGGVIDRSLEEWGVKDERRSKGEERETELQREERWHCETGWTLERSLVQGHAEVV